MSASLVLFSATVKRIQENSWWSENFDPGKNHHKGFTYQVLGDREIITLVPKEAFESLLLHVRKLTMADAPENLHKVQKKLKASTPDDRRRHLLDVWHKYWRIAFIKDSFEIESAGKKQLMTPYRVYDCFINGQLFHTNDPQYNTILHGASNPTALMDGHLFLRNMLHSTVTNLCLAALGLQWYIDSMPTPQIMLAGYHTEVFRFVFERNNVAQLDEQYRVYNDWLEANGGCPHGRW